ncbi:Imm52 family immunity protein [Amycolatopsis pigmentata]|uniref:Imm52 family immunity protein n=1 Tax=Amycolatopsis pigmentata TaxID=450801 RepID=A0ABW5FZJ8_9PSEU
MPSPFYLGAYWGSRVESAEACAGRFARFLRRLAEVESLPSTWWKVGRDEAESRRERIEPSQQNLRRLLEASYDPERPRLGFSVHVWDRTHDSVRFNVICGSPAVVSPNVVVFELPRPTEENSSLYQAETMKLVFSAVVEEWDPEWAIFATREMREMQVKLPRRPIAGWLTYLRTDPSAVSPLGSDIEISGLGEGTLLVAGPEPLLVTEKHIREVANLVSQVNVEAR